MNGLRVQFLQPEFSHKDKRRTITQLLTSNIKQINVYEANHGAELGNHFHKETNEYFYIVRGSLKYNNQITLKKGDIFYPELGEKHTLKVVSDKATFMTFLDKSYSQENPDTYV